MKNTLVEAKLSMKDFARYFEAKRLGRLSFPNGESYSIDGFVDFYIRLNDLYKLASDWKVNLTLVPLDDIVAIIAFGSAVRYPGTIPGTRQQYWLFGKDVQTKKQVRIMPRDADFLVITKGNLIREEVLDPTLAFDNYGASIVRKGGIHLINRGVDQLLKGIHANDTVSASALREGVPLFSNGRLESVLAQANIESTTPRKLFWDEDNDGCLTGRIQ